MPYSKTPHGIAVDDGTGARTETGDFLPLRGELALAVSALLVGFLAAGCSSAPASPEPAPTGARARMWVEAPGGPAGQAVMTFYRKKRFAGSALDTPIFVDGKKVADLDNGTYVTVAVEPGEHQVRSDEEEDALRVAVKAGREYFFRVYIATGVWKGHGALLRMPGGQGRAEFTTWAMGPARDVRVSRMVTASPSRLAARSQAGSRPLASAEQGATRFADNGDGTVTDRFTGLIWLKDARCPSARKTRKEARDFVAQLNNGSVTCEEYAPGSYADWRVPRIKELVSVVDYGRFDPALPSGHPFTNVLRGDWYLSASSYRPDRYKAFVMSMSTGDVEIGIVSEDAPDEAYRLGLSGEVVTERVFFDPRYAVWPVRKARSDAGGPELEDPTARLVSVIADRAPGHEAEPTRARLTDNHDGTVTDNVTNLIWLRDANCPSGSKTRQEALDWIAALNRGSIGCTGYPAGTFDDWRMPRLKELATLLDYGEVDPPLPAGHPFQNVKSRRWLEEFGSAGQPILTYFYWTSSPTIWAGEGNFWIVHMVSGRILPSRENRRGYLNSSKNWLWPVRNGD